MDLFQCCRTCLADQDLCFIFTMPEHEEKYTEVIYNTTGIKVQHSDSLSKLMCAQCITFINKSHKFRKKCQDSQKLLFNQLNQNPIEIKTEPNMLKSDSPYIDIADLLIDDDFQDYDDNITLSQYSMIGKYNQSQVQHQSNDNATHAMNNPNTSQLSIDNVTLAIDKGTLPIDNDIIPIDNVTFSIDNVTVSIDDKEVKGNTLSNSKLHSTTDKSDLNQLIPPNNITEVKNKEKPAKKRGRTKKENQEEKRTKEKKERVKEEIECELCHKVLTSKLSLRNHNKIHTGFDVVCEHCGKKFITRRLLLMHCKAKHGYEKTDKCSYCDYKASNAEQVKIHERLHTGEKPYACASCGARFHRKSSYLQHVAIHLPDKTVQCEVCPARFKSVTLMRIHRARHRPPQYTYCCRVCGDTFARRRNVARHLARIHALPPADYIQRAKR